MSGCSAWYGPSDAGGPLRGRRPERQPRASDLPHPSGRRYVGYWLFVVAPDHVGFFSSCLRRSGATSHGRPTDLAGREAATRRTECAPLAARRGPSGSLATLRSEDQSCHPPSKHSTSRSLFAWSAHTSPGARRYRRGRTRNCKSRVRQQYGMQSAFSESANPSMLKAAPLATRPRKPPRLFRWMKRSA